MGKPVSLFSGYSQAENRVTNYCLLVLKMLYEENPKYLGEFLDAVTSGRVGGEVGVAFEQQVRVGTSVLDGVITQSPVKIYIETKNWDWFYDAQLQSHLEALNSEGSGSKVLIALSRFDGPTDARFEEIHKECEERYRGELALEPVSFDDFIAAIEQLDLPKNLADTVSELRGFFDGQGLLSTWQMMLDVINCAGIPEDVRDGNVYMCPAAGGAYSHQRCRYFGMYRNKRVECVASIDAVIDVDPAGESELKWKNVERLDSELMADAEAKHGRWLHTDQSIHP